MLHVKLAPMHHSIHLEVMRIVNNTPIDGCAQQTSQLLPVGLAPLAAPLNDVHATPQVTKVEVIEL